MESTVTTDGYSSAHLERVNQSQDFLFYLFCFQIEVLHNVAVVASGRRQKGSCGAWDKLIDHGWSQLLNSSTKQHTLTRLSCSP